MKKLIMVHIWGPSTFCVSLYVLCASTIIFCMLYYETISLSPDSTEKWVGVILEGQLGNQLWAMASSHGLAKARGARWCWIDTNSRWATYRKYIEWLTDPPQQCTDTGWGGWLYWLVGSSYHYISDNGDYAKYTDRFEFSKHDRILVKGMLQSYRFFNHDLPVPFKLRASSIARHWVRERGVTVAIHARRGDKLWDIGNVVPPMTYYNSAMSLLRKLFPSPTHQFVIATDDLAWVQSQPEFSGMYTLMSEDPSFDMAVIAACKHKILSIGTFGWWGAYLGDTGDNRTSAVIYPVLQMAWPKASGFNNSDYFPPHWTGIDYALES